MGTVISCSTSLADKPRASVWISTVVGPNSGSVSTGISRTSLNPRNIRAAAMTTIGTRALRQPSISQRIDGYLLRRGGFSCRSSLTDAFRR